jgi:hypothetical protein
MLEIYTPATKQVRLPSYYVRHANNITKMWNKRHCNVESRVSWIATGTMSYVHRLDSALKHKTQGTKLFSSCTQKSSRQLMFDMTPTTYVSRWGPMFKLSERLPSILTLVCFHLTCICCTVCSLLFSTLDAGLLARSQYSEGPATGHLDTGFSWCPCVYMQMLRWFPRFQITTTCFSCSPPDLNLLVTNFVFCIDVK